MAVSSNAGFCCLSDTYCCVVFNMFPVDFISIFAIKEVVTTQMTSVACRCWRLFMIKLWNHSLLDARTMNNCSLILERNQNEALGAKQN